MKKKIKHVNIVTLAQLAWYERKNDYTFDFEKSTHKIICFNFNVYVDRKLLSSASFRSLKKKKDGK